jgi:hypothetical protein
VAVLYVMGVMIWRNLQISGEILIYCFVLTKKSI